MVIMRNHGLKRPCVLVSRRPRGRVRGADNSLVHLCKVVSELLMRLFCPLHQSFSAHCVNPYLVDFLGKTNLTVLFLQALKLLIQKLFLVNQSLKNVVFLFSFQSLMMCGISIFFEPICE